MKYLRFAVLPLAMLMISSCMFRFDRKDALRLLEEERVMMVTPSRVYVSVDTAVGDFCGIAISGISEVEFVQDDVSPHVQIYGSDNIVPFVKAEIKDSLLNLSWKEKKGAFNDDLKVTVYAPSISVLTMAGSVDFKCTHLEVPDIEFSAMMAGSGDAEFGRIVCRSLNVSLAGSSDIEFMNVHAGDTHINIAGSGDLDMSGIDTGSIEVSVAGSGDVRLDGTAGTADYSIRGSGEINAENLKCPDTSSSIRGSGSVVYQDADGRKTVK